MLIMKFYFNKNIQEEHFYVNNIKLVIKNLLQLFRNKKLDEQCCVCPFVDGFILYLL